MNDSVCGSQILPLDNIFTPEIDVTRASDQLESLTGDSALTSAREPKELNHGAHEAQPTRAIDMLASGAVDGVEGQ